MAGPRSPSGPAPDALERHVAELTAMVEALRAELAALRVQLAEEVRTHRIVLVEEDGFERLVLAADDRGGEVALYGRATDGRVTCVELFANNPIDDHGAHVGVALTDHDEVVAVLEVVERARPTLWLEGQAVRSARSRGKAGGVQVRRRR